MEKKEIKIKEEEEREEEKEENDNVIRSEEEYFLEWHNVNQFIEEIITNKWKETWELKWETISTSLLIFQEQPTLLGPYLEGIIVPLTNCLIEILQQYQQEIFTKFQRMENMQFHVICKVLQLFCRIRGYKHVIKYFPHEVWHIELCMSALRAQDKTDHNNWETRYIMLLWLCMLCLIPFDICSMDSTMSQQTHTYDHSIHHEHQSKLVLDMISICKEHLSESGPTREASYACLSALFTRPDMESSILADFMAWSCSKLNNWTEKGSSAEFELNKESFQVIGLLHCLGQIFKKGHRNNILPYASQILIPCFLIFEQPNQTLVRKLLVKVCQRIALTFLPPREATWRYQRGSRSLLQNLQQSIGKEIDSHSSLNQNNQNNNNQEEDEIDIPSEMEDIVEKLLISLRDKDTVVRWSAAKGIGRITMRLPLEFGDDVVGAVISIFEDTDADSAWHGGCLALAELSRRGLLLPSRLDTVIPIIVRAMHFDILRGQHSVGAHVRDAASYVCWAFARAYAPSVMRPYISVFSEAMILAALFDREINCRRAASAAFQENVGRQGNENFPFGMEVIAVADYFSLGNRNSAYLNIAPQVAKLNHEFLEFMLKHLSKVKLGHWDSEIRIVAAKSLGQLTKLDPNLAILNLQEIIVHTMSSIPNLRHGSLFAIAEIIKSYAFYHPNLELPEDITSEITQLVLKLDKSRLFRGKGGEQLREASCNLIEVISKIQLSMPIKIQVNLVEFLNENLRQPHEHIQLAAANGLRQILFSYFPVSITEGPSTRLQTLTVLKYMEGLKTEENVAATRGYALALGTLPYKLISLPNGRLKEVFDCLSQSIDPNRKIAGESDPETRRNSINSLIELTEKILPQRKSSNLEINNENNEILYTLDQVIDILLKTCEDYSIDKRGDTGSWCRIAGMKGLERLILVSSRHLNQSYPCQITNKFSYIINSSLHFNENSPITIGSHVITSYGHALVKNILSYNNNNDNNNNNNNNNIPKIISVVYPPKSFGEQNSNEHEEKEKDEKEIILPTKGLINIGSSYETIIQSISPVFKVPNFNDRRLLLLSSLDCSGISTTTIQESSNYLQTYSNNNNQNLLIPIFNINESKMKIIIGVILKQLGEKLDAVREVAGDILKSLLRSTDPCLDNIPDKPILSGCLSTIEKRISDDYEALIGKNKSSIIKKTSSSSTTTTSTTIDKWTQSKYVYTFLIGALDSNHYFKYILNGLIISVGALSEGIGKESLQALLHWCHVQKSSRNLRDLSLLGSVLVEIFQLNAKISRVTLPLMKTFQSLLKNDVFNPILTSKTSSDSCSLSLGYDLMKCVENELAKCTEVAKIRTGIDLYILLLGFNEPVRSSTWKLLIILIGHKYPKIRKYVVELLYLQLISDSNAVGATLEEILQLKERNEKIGQVDNNQLIYGLTPNKEVLQKVMDILTTTVWDDENLEFIREKRKEICLFLNLQVNFTEKKNTGKSKSNEKKTDELDSYDSLVREAGY